MNDGPGLSAWDLANARTASADAASREWLDRVVREEMAQDRARLAYIPVGGYYWPGWAIRIGTNGDGCCITCDTPILRDVYGRGRENLSGLCGKCGRKLGGNKRAGALNAYRKHTESKGEP